MINKNKLIPIHRVVKTDKMITNIIWKDSSEFINPFTKEEQETIIKASSTRILTNDPVFRLESLNNGTAKIAQINFFDFMTTNYFYSNQNNVSNAKILKKKLLQNLKDCDTNDFDSILSQKALANPLAISLLLEDFRGNYLFCTRSSSVAVASAEHACSVTASMNLSDFNNTNPFIACAARELYEELGLYADLSLQQIVISKQKLQPTVLLHGLVRKPFTELCSTMVRARDYNRENCFMHAIPKTKVLRAIRYNDFTDIAAYHVFYTVTNGKLDYSTWRNETKQPLEVADFLLQM